MRRPEPLCCDLAVIGMGLAGMAAALFASRQGLSVVQIGYTGETLFSTGLLDLLGVYPVLEKKRWKDPWAGIQDLTQHIPNHPYARMTRCDIESSLDRVIAFLDESGLSYVRGNGSNAEMIMPLGLTKETYAAPKSMWGGIRALSKRTPCLLVDFQGLSDFSARQIAAVLGPRWPGLAAARVPFPGEGRKVLLTGEMMAMALELPQNREKLAATITPLIGDAQIVGLPAVLGMNATLEIMAELEQRIGVPVFEIPTFPISVPGLRLHEAFSKGLRKQNVKRLGQGRVVNVREERDRHFLLKVDLNGLEGQVKSRGIILASGRFWGRGLVADQDRIREALLDLPVEQPSGRRQWHRRDFLDPRGHPVNRAGLEIDPLFRPLSRTGGPAFDRLFAAGSILAHQDWMRTKCGAGLAISTACAAVNGFMKVR